VIEYDIIRTEYLETAWVKVCRLTNKEIENNLQWALEKLKDFIYNQS
jgi:very-short-patch-repair endonuclease